jgi:carbon-monoxide dehydrogenase small subunit
MTDIDDVRTFPVSEEAVTVRLRVNGNDVEARVSPRLLLSDFLRQEMKLTGTHVGCEHGVCGACTIHIDGRPARSCLTLVVQTEGGEIRTIENLETDDGLHPVQQAFRECHALQCGFCTPGFIMSVAGLIEERDDLEEAADDEVREAIAGNLCRCTGYQNIVAAVRRAAALRRNGGEEDVVH